MDLSKEETELIEKVLLKHRQIMSKSGYGKIVIEYSKNEIQVTGHSSDKSTIKLNAVKVKQT